MLERYAQEIASSTAEVIDYDVIITNVRGIITGASDPEREIGSLHEASLRVIETGRGDSMDDATARQLVGTQSGVTYPIEDPSGALVGTIAITGNPEKVTPFALIVKKQAEILLREKSLLESAINREQSLQNLVREISLFDPEQHDEAALSVRAQNLGLSPDSHQIAIALRLFEFDDLVSDIRKRNNESRDSEMMIQSIKTRVLLSIRQIFDIGEDVSTTVDTSRFIIFHSLGKDPSSGIRELHARLREKCELLLKRLEEEKIIASIGIGLHGRGLTGLCKTFHEASQALNIGERLLGTPGIYDIMDLQMEEFLITSNRKSAAHFVRKHIMDAMERPDWPEIQETILVWCDYGFSIGRAAERLHVHRNTLDYRLDKIQRIFDFNPRNFREILNIYMAIKLKSLIEPERTSS